MRDLRFSQDSVRWCRRSRFAVILSKWSANRVRFSGVYSDFRVICRTALRLIHVPLFRLFLTGSRTNHANGTGFTGNGTRGIFCPHSTIANRQTQAFIHSPLFLVLSPSTILPRGTQRKGRELERWTPTRWKWLSGPVNPRWSCFNPVLKAKRRRFYGCWKHWLLCCFSFWYCYIIAGHPTLTTKSLPRFPDSPFVHHHPFCTLSRLSTFLPQSRCRTRAWHRDANFTCLQEPASSSALGFAVTTMKNKSSCCVYTAACANSFKFDKITV